MKRHRKIHSIALKGLLLWLGVLLSTGLQLQAQEPTKAELMQRLERLNKQLESTKAALAESEEQRVAAEKAAETPASEKVGVLEEQIANAADMGPSKITPGDLIPALEGLKIGGAIRANYVMGDYGGETGGPSNDYDDNGTIGLDTFRINMDYENGPWVGKFEYRFYNGGGGYSYNMLHTGWLGYNFENEDQIQVGVNRVPFGPGAYGISQSWFFDQHYYVGLSDDMDLGVKYSGSRGDLSFDLAYYYSDEGQWAGDTSQSARYSYDVVDESGNGYEERNQFNARAIYSMELGEVSLDLGASAQYSQLESNGPQDDGDHYALSIHPVFKWNNWTLSTQLTKYEYDIDAYLSDQNGLTDELVQFGAYDFPTLMAAEAWIAGASLSYYHEIGNVEWVDYVIPYVEYSSIMKEADDYNDSELFTVGAAWGRGGWYIYTELAASNGNDFVGSEAAYSAAPNFGRFGANQDDDWQTRFNINFGYYF